MWRCRPSEIYKISDELAAYSFDSAVGLFGSSLEAALEAVEGKNAKDKERKRLQVMKKWLPDSPTGSQQKFRDPMQATKGLI